MTADTFQFNYFSHNFNGLSEKLDFTCAFKQHSSQCSVGLITYKNNGTFFSPEIVLKMVSYTSGFTHSRRRDYYFRLIIRVNCNRIITCNGKRKPRKT